MHTKLLFVVLVFFTTYLKAAEKTSFFSITFQGGVAIANVVVTPTANLNGVTTPKFGGSLDFNMGNVALELGSFYTLKGGATATITNRFYYLEFPALLKIKFFKSRRFKPYIFGGASIAPLISAYRITSSATVDIKSSTSTYDYGVLFGGGFEFMASKKIAIVVDGRYSYGIADIDPDPTTSTQNRVIEILAGFKFYL